LEEKPDQVEFDLISTQTLVLGPMTRFKVQGIFESKVAATAAEANPPWAPISAADAWTKVSVAPNWFDIFIKSLDVFQGNYKITTTDEARHVWPHLNAFLYNYMTKERKNMLCPEACHPGRGVPDKDKSWSMVEATGTEWRDYSANIFTGNAIEFHYTPLHIFPFFQGTNYPDQFNALPLPVLGKMSVRLSFIDKMDSIFKKAAANASSYRFRFEKIELMTELARLNTNFERSFYAKKNQLNYAGVTKMMVSETIPNVSLNHKTRFQNVPFPEGIFIFCLPKTVVGSTWTYQTNGDNNVFSPHNIKSMAVYYDNQAFSFKEPNFGMIEHSDMEIKSLFDHLISPPFGSQMDPEKVTLEKMKNGAIATPYPHVYLNLTNHADKSRIVPFLNEGHLLTQSHDLDIHFNFKASGSTADVNYMIYLSYTDVNVVLDMKSRSFSSPYIKK
jgi:hypothetical protein